MGILDKLRGQKIEEFSLDAYQNISEHEDAERLYAVGVARRQNELNKAARHVGWRPKMRESAQHFIPVILRCEENAHASGGQAVALYYYNLHIGYVSEDDLKAVKRRMNHHHEVKADANLCCNPIEKLMDAASRWYVIFEA